MIGQITANIGTATAIRIFTPGPSCKNACIQNNGTVDVRLSYDGGSDMPGRTGNLPTSTTGFRLPAGQQFFMNYPAAANGISPRTVWAIGEAAGAVALDISSDDKDSKAS